MQVNREQSGAPQRSARQPNPMQPNPIQLSPMQRTLWASHRLNPDDPVQNMALLTHLDGVIDAKRLATAFAKVVAGSDVLRTRIIDQAGLPTVVLGSAPAETTVLRVPRDETESWGTTRVKAPLDIGVRAYDSVVLQHEDNTSSWYLALHHTVTDATSSSLVFAATAQAYEGIEQDFASYYEWAGELESRDGKRTSVAKDHWESRVHAPLLGRLYKNVRRPTPACTRVSTDLEPSLTELAKTRFGSDYAMLSHDLAWTTLLLTVTAAHLHRCTGADIFAVGLPVHGRGTPISRALLGPVMEVFPVDVAIESNDTFRSLHRRIGRSILTTLRHAVSGTAPQRADYETIVNVISRGDMGNFGNIECVTRWIHSGASEPSHLLSLQATPHGNTEVRLEVDLNHGGVDPSHIERAPEQILALLRAMLEDPDAKVGEVTMLDRREAATLERWGRRTQIRSSSPRLLPTLETALRNNPSCVIEDPTTSLTGPELWDRVTRTAAWLRTQDVQRGRRVGVCMVRSVDAVVSILAILLAGGSYVPLEPGHPAERRRRLADRAGCTLVLDELDPPDQLPQPNELIRSDQRHHEDETYLLFTSGSTGEPKGVPISDLGVDNYLAFAHSTYIDDGTTANGQVRPIAPLFSSLSFDLTVTSLFAPLVGGGKLVVIPEDGPTGLQRVADRSDLTWMKATPSHLELLLRFGPRSRGLRTLVVGGEAFSTSLATKLGKTFDSVRVFNEYGPTEAVVGCMVHEHTSELFTDEGTVPVGVPAPGVDLRIVDQYQNLAPVGSIGELCIAHDGLTIGYIDSAGNNGVAPDPNRAFFELDGRRFYRSGDMVRLIDDETLTYLGRVDDQVKIGGIRLQPSEVEHELSGHAAIVRSAVRVWSAESNLGGRDLLTAWIEVRAGHRRPTPAQLRSFLSTRLPRYSVPTAYVFLASLPVTNNGKLDETALRGPTRGDLSGESIYVAPASDLETSVVAAYRQILGVEVVAMGDDFFDLGGDSLAALEMISVLGASLGVRLREELAFSHTSPAELAEAIVSGTVANESAQLSGPVRRPIGTPPPLSDGETALLFEHLSDPTSTRYNVSRSYVIHGPVDSERFIEAAGHTAANHVPLSWTFADQRVPLVTDEALDARALSAPVTAAQFANDAEQQHAMAFDLESGPLVRLLIAPLDDGTTAVTLSFHHISIDAVSFDRIWEQIDSRYRGVEAHGNGFDYADHATWQRDRDRTSDAAFWLSSDNCRQSADLALGTPGVDELGDRVPDRYIEIPASFSAGELAHGPGTTPFATVLAALASTLRRRADSDTIAISTTASTREHPAAASLVGYYLNTLPLLIDVAPDESLASVALRCTTVLGAALEHRTYPYGDIVAERRRAGIRPPARSVLLAFQQLEPSSFDGMACEHSILSSDAAVTDATLFVQVRGEHIDLGIEYSGDVLDERLALLLLRDLDSVVRDAIDSPDLPINELDLGSVVGPVRGAVPTFDTEKSLLDTIVGHFSEQPDAAAVRFAENTVSYRELGAQSHELATRLKAAGAGPGRFVAVEAVRHSDTIVAILAILRVGAAYVPIDPDYPADHIDHIFAEADVDLLVTATGATSRLARSAVRVIGVKAPIPGGPSAEAMGPGASGNDPAYVIYTSGSTGRPKGVVVSHANLAYSTVARNQVYSNAADRFLLLSSFAFDSSMVGLFWTLHDGGTVIVPEPGAQLDVWALCDLVESERATHMLAIPSFYRLLVSEAKPDQLSSLQTVIVAGEVCHPDVADAHRLAGVGADLYNEYGPTEATVWSHFHRIDTTKPPGVVPIGKPLPGITTIVVDESNQPVPSGVPGELLISGPTVTKGYHNAEDLTAERYVHLDATPSADAATRWYRTGDLVESHTDGGLVFKGRLDDQVKVRGFRVELGNIETAALSVDGVHTAIAGLTNSGGDKGTQAAQLCLWYRDDGSVDPGELRDQLRASPRLAEHMVPVFYKRIESVPRTANGKIDRQSLPEPEVPARTSRPADVEAGSDEELALAAVWAEVLQLEAVGTEDNFFDLGGDSIVSIQVVARLRKLGYHLTPRDVFTHQNIRELAKVVCGLGRIDAEQGPVTGDVGLTPIQQWFFSQDLEKRNHWNQSLWLRLERDTDLDSLEAAALHLGTHHDTLRLRFAESPEGWSQTHAELARPVKFTRHGGPGSDVVSAETRALLAAQADDSLDLEAGDLMAVVALVSAETVELYVTVHHLVMDTVSWSPLLEDWAVAYEQIRTDRNVSFEAKTTSFKAWSNQLHAMAAKSETATFWVAQPVPETNAGGGGDANNVQGVAHRVAVTGDRSVTDALISSRRAQNVLLAATAVALGELNGRDHLDVMLEGHGREDDLFPGTDLSRTVGWFTTRYPVRVPTSDEAGPEGVLGLVNAVLDQIPDRGIGYGVAREVAANPELTSRPEPGIAFNYLGQLDRSLAVNLPFVEAGALFGPIAASNRRAHTLGIIAYVQSHRLTVEVEYVESHTDTQTAESLAQSIVELVSRLVESESASPQNKFELAGLDESQLSDLGNLLDKLDADRS